MTDFKPTLLGTPVSFHGEGDDGMITDENESEIYIESEFFTGWMEKSEFFELWGVEE